MSFEVGGVGAGLTKDDCGLTAVLLAAWFTRSTSSVIPRTRLRESPFTF